MVRSGGPCDLRSPSTAKSRSPSGLAAEVATVARVSPATSTQSWTDHLQRSAADTVVLVLDGGQKLLGVVGRCDFGHEPDAGQTECCVLAGQVLQSLVEAPASRLLRAV